MAFNDTAKSTVIIDGKQAEEQLKKLQTESKELKAKMEDLRKSNDLAGFTKLEKEVKANAKAQAELRKELFSVDTVMKNLSGASMNQLKAAQRAITAELNKMTRGTEEYIAKSKQLDSVNKEISSVKTQMNSTGGVGESMWNRLGMAATKFMGIGAAAWGAIKSGQVIIESTSALSDKFAESLGGIKAGFHSIIQAVARLDFNDFWANTKEAINTGKEIARMQDQLEDKKRVLTILEGKYELEISKQKDIAADARKSDDERKKALAEAIRLEYELSKYRIDTAKLDFDTKEKAMMLETKLSKEQLENFFETYNNNNELRTQAEEYLDLKKKFNELPGVTEEEKQRADATTNFIGQWREQIASTSDEVKIYATILEAYGKGADKTIDEFVQSWGDYLAVQKRVYDETVRIKKQETGLEKKGTKSGSETVLKELDDAYQKRRALIVQHFSNEKLDQDWFDQTMLSNEIAYLMTKEEILRNSGEKTAEIQADIALKELELQKKINAKKEKENEKKAQSDEEYFKQQAEMLKQQEEDIWNSVLEQEKARDKAIDDYNNQMTQYKGISDSMAASMGEALGNFISNSSASSEEFAKAMVLTMLDALHTIVRMSIVSVWAQSLAQPDSVLTFGATGVGRAIAISAIIEAAFGVVKAVVSNMMSSAGGGTKQRYAGKYDVVGADDGRSYSAGYGGAMRTGIYGTPTLVAERGDELVVDHNTLRNIRVNFPYVLPAIRAAMVPQHAAGNVSSMIPSNTPTIDPRLESMLQQNAVVMSMLIDRLNKPINADISYKRVVDKLAKGSAAESRGSKLSG